MTYMPIDAVRAHDNFSQHIPPEEKTTNKDREQNAKEPITVTDDVRHSLAEFLPDALATALQSYHSFARTEIPEDAKGFSAHHSACKMAISHIDLLLKLAQWADIDVDEMRDLGERKHLNKMLSAAQMQYKSYCVRH